MNGDELTGVFPGAADWRGRHVVILAPRSGVGRPPGADRPSPADPACGDPYGEEVARRLHRAGVHVTWLAPRPAGAPRRHTGEHGTVRRDGGPLTVRLFVLLWLWRHRQEVDAVLEPGDGLPFLAPLVLPRRTPVLLLLRPTRPGTPTAPSAGMPTSLAYRLVHGSRALCAPSPSARAAVRARLRPSGPVHLAPPGTTQAPPPTAEAQIRRRAATPRIVCAGGLDDHARGERLLRAVHALRRDLPAELHLVGDGPARHQLERLAAELGLDATVVFHGPLPGPRRAALFASAWVAVTGPPGGDWPAATLEAAAAGVPCLVPDLPGARDAVREGRTGWLYPPDGDLADALRRALRALRAPGEAARHDAACRAWARRFTWTATAGHVLAALSAESVRLDGPPSQRRAPATDAATLVTLPHDALRTADLRALRATDLLDTSGPRAELLLGGADEQDAAAVLRRAGLEPGDERITVRPARHEDTLGRQRHPPAGLPPKVPYRPGPRPARWWPAALAAVFCLALALRLYAVRRAYDVFHDELYYVGIAVNLAEGDGVTFQGRQFALHPPALFAVLAAALRCGAGPYPGLLETTLALRWVVCLTGAVLVTTVVALLRRTVRPWIALAAGVLLALDPFLNRFDSRVMMEAQATAACVAGVLALARRPATRRGRTATAWAAGLLFALAVTTKESYALITVLPVLLLGLRTRDPARGTRLTAAAVAVGGYALYLFVLAATGGFPGWFGAKREGLARALGLAQISGFNSPGSPPFLDRLAANGALYATSYALIGLGACATGWLVWRRLRMPDLFAGAPGRALITVCSGCATVALLYAIGWGTLEEQMFYPLLVTGTAALAVATDLATDLAAARRRARAPGPVRTPRPRDLPGRRARSGAALAVVLTAAVLLDLSTWAQVHTRADDAYRRTAAWARTHLPAGAAIAATDETTELVLPGARLKPWKGADSLGRHDIRYVIVAAGLADRGYARIDPGLYRELRRTRPLYVAPGRTTGTLLVYDVGPMLGH